jgi:transcriptional regulator with XRE-family HTH domain
MEREELAAIRRKLGLTQQEASKITGGGKNAFSRYERGEAQPVLGVVTLFRVLGAHPELLAEVGLPHKVPTATFTSPMVFAVKVVTSGGAVVSDPDFLQSLNVANTGRESLWISRARPELLNYPFQWKQKAVTEEWPSGTS